MDYYYLNFKMLQTEAADIFDRGQMISFLSRWKLAQMHILTTYLGTMYSTTLPIFCGTSKNNIFRATFKTKKKKNNFAFHLHQLWSLQDVQV